nr:NADH dehydrogenase subunit 2 [Eurythoe complanata]ALO81716.1 NADH dehydrogenase subunit 2 [Eurythoe complanata]
MLPSLTIFSSTLIASTIIALSSSHWLLLWMALELNLLSFVPLMTSSSNHQETEAAIKYFLAQATGSATLLFGVLLTYSNIFYWMNELILPIILSSLLLKMGAAPFHFWFPNVMSGLSWTSCLLLSTWQKIIPLGILMSLSASATMFIMVISSLSSLVGGIGGMNQTFLRPLLAYSSIGHIGWMLGISMFNLMISLIYFTVYSLILLPLLFILNHSQLSNIRQSLSISHIPATSQMTALLILLSLGGLPPLLGFLPKWLTLEHLSFFPQATPMMMALLLGSLMNLFYYLNVTFSLSLPPMSSTTLNINSTPLFISSLPPITLITLMTPLLMLALYFFSMISTFAFQAKSLTTQKK